MGRRVWEMYQARGFVFPGQPGSAPPLLAQHDWVHVLADYGTTVEAELEVFAFIARANDDMRAYSLLAMVLSLFETGYLRVGAGTFQSDTATSRRTGEWRFDSGTRSGGARSARIAKRARTASTTSASTGSRWRIYPSRTARARFNVTPKSDDAMAAGSVGPWQPGGISPFQERAGREQARRDDRRFEANGAARSAD